MYLLLLIITSSIFSYLMGSIPTSLIIGKLFFNKDIREHGSGNLGGTNAGRVLGKKIGLLVMILDQVKAALTILIVSLIAKNSNLNYYQIFIYISMIFLVIGHCYPIFANFKGGKAVAVTFGIIFITNIYIYLISLLIYVIILKFTKFVSLSSIIIFYLSFILSLFNIFRVSPFLSITFNYGYSIMLFILASYVVIKHRPNIERLINKKENKIKWM